MIPKEIALPRRMNQCGGMALTPGVRGSGRRFLGGRREKTNSPTFAYQTVYGKNPSGFLPGRTDAPKKIWKGIAVDEGLKDRWLKSLNDLPVEIRSSEEGKSPLRPAAIVFRLPKEHDKRHKEMVRNLRKIPGVYSKSDVGMAGRPRICVAGKIWKGQKDWEQWWEKLPEEINKSYQKTIEKTAMETTFFDAFIDEMGKIAKGWEPGQQGPISADLPKELSRKKKLAVAAIHGPRGGVTLTKDEAVALAARGAGKRVIWGG